MDSRRPCRRRTPGPRCDAAVLEVLLHDRPRRCRRPPWPPTGRCPRRFSDRPRSAATFMPRPPPPAVALMMHRVAHLAAERTRVHRRSGTTRRPSPERTGHAEFLRGLLGGDLVAHHPDMLGRRADEGEPVVLDDLHELGVLGEETVARVDRLGAGDLAGGDDGRAPRGSCPSPAAGRCRPPRRPCAHAWRRCRRWNARRRSESPFRGRPESPSARSRRGWRSGSCRTSGGLPSLDDHQGRAELDRRGIFDQDGASPCPSAAPGSGSWSSSLR